MSLDLGNTALQIERMTEYLRARQNDKQRRLVRAIQETESFDTATYREKRERSRNTFNFLPAPGVNNPRRWHTIHTLPSRPATSA